MSAIQYAVNLATTPAIADPHIIWAFAGPSIVGFILSVVFWFVFKHLNNEEYVVAGLDSDSDSVILPADHRVGDEEDSGSERLGVETVVVGEKGAE